MLSAPALQAQGNKCHGGSVSSARWTQLKPLAALCAGVINQLFNLPELLENWGSWWEMGAACSFQLHSLQAGLSGKVLGFSAVPGLPIYG